MKTKLAEDHWAYIQELLKAHGVHEAYIDIVKFHYISSFIHGFKHGVESCEATLIPTEYENNE